MNRKFRSALLLILSVASCLAQVATGNFRGTITDATGAVLPNCSVLIANTMTGFQRSVSSNERGDFNAPSVPIGIYDVSAELAGFQRRF